MEAHEQGKFEQVSRAPRLGAVCPGGAGSSWGEELLHAGQPGDHWCEGRGAIHASV